MNEKVRPPISAKAILSTVRLDDARSTYQRGDLVIVDVVGLQWIDVFRRLRQVDVYQVLLHTIRGGQVRSWTSAAGCSLRQR